MPELRLYLLLLLFCVGSDDDPETVVVGDRLWTCPTVALRGAGYGGNAVERPAAQRALIGFRGILRIFSEQRFTSEYLKQDGTQDKVQWYFHNIILFCYF
jgi:hypothetical protein